MAGGILFSNLADRKLFDVVPLAAHIRLFPIPIESLSQRVEIQSTSISQPCRSAERDFVLVPFQRGIIRNTQTHQLGHFGLRHAKGNADFVQFVAKILRFVSHGPPSFREFLEKFYKNPLCVARKFISVCVIFGLKLIFFQLFPSIPAKHAYLSRNYCLFIPTSSQKRCSKSHSTPYLPEETPLL